MNDNAQLALDTLLQRPTQGIPTWLLNVMEHPHIERLAGTEIGSYQREPERVYLAMQKAIGVCLLDQFIPENPLVMGSRGYEGSGRSATTGAEEIWADGMRIDSPEDVVAHMERFVFPALQKGMSGFDVAKRAQDILSSEKSIQARLGPDMLKSGHGFVAFPALDYGRYGYVHYFSAYALYPEVMEKLFSLQADWAVLNNQAAAQAYQDGEGEGHLAPLYRLDHDMADSRGTLVDERSLDRIWFPHFARAMEPLLKADVRLIWHCDGNLMKMVPRLLEVGLRGFQGFQYECGMDYERICRMKAKDGSDLIIIAGGSVTTTLPMGSPADVKKELDWLVAQGPRTGLFLGASSSIAPGVPWENLRTFVEGLQYYRQRGRQRGRQKGSR